MTMTKIDIAAIQAASPTEPKCRRAIMIFVEGFLTPVPTASKQAYLEHASSAVDLFKRFGVTCFVETWGDDVPNGKTNDLKQSVTLENGETVLFSWFEYPTGPRAKRHTRK